MDNLNVPRLYVHPIFKFLDKNFRFFFIGMNMMMVPVFQNDLIREFKDSRPVIEITVDFPPAKNLQYDVQETIFEFNREVGLKKDGSKITCNLNSLIIPWARQVAISMFEVLQTSKYNKLVNKTDIFKFAKHIRNGAAHNNKFNFSKPLNKPLQWRNKTIGNSLQNTEVFNAFMNGADLMFLISDLSNLINQKDIKHI